MSFRKTIRREVERRGLSGYAVAKLVEERFRGRGREPPVKMRMIQRYLCGQADLSGERLEVLCDALGLQLRPVRVRPAKRKG